MIKQGERANEEWFRMAEYLAEKPGARGKAMIWLSNPDRGRCEFPLWSGRTLPVGSLGEVVLLRIGFSKVRYEANRDIGGLLRKLVSKGLSESTANARLLSLTRQPWVSAVPSLRSILANGQSHDLSLDWINLGWAAVNWPKARHLRDMQKWAASFAQVEAFLPPAEGLG